eukprot:6458301-Amphidinium_carterae.1
MKIETPEIENSPFVKENSKILYLPLAIVVPPTRNGPRVVNGGRRRCAPAAARSSGGQTTRPSTSACGFGALWWAPSEFGVGVRLCSSQHAIQCWSPSPRIEGAW